MIVLYASYNEQASGYESHPIKCLKNPPPPSSSLLSIIAHHHLSYFLVVLPQYPKISGKTVSVVSRGVCMSLVSSGGLSLSCLYDIISSRLTKCFKLSKHSFKFDVFLPSWVLPEQVFPLVERMIIMHLELCHTVPTTF